ncbi:MAG TPA: type IX secretion system membrane protein PorP/SprF [Brumimicrobium sp.]|nr:type IX secretion system membrane protein PorP/SprF [Brumimicrobium sp.]
MSRPTFENIDQWLFEFTEGTLSVGQESQLIDFLRENPEVMTDLKAWNLSKASSKTTPAFSTASLMKPTPLILRPVSMVLIGVLAISLGWLGYNNYPSPTLYSKAIIDAEIIYVDDEDNLDNQLFIANNTSGSHSEAKAKEELALINKSSLSNTNQTVKNKKKGIQHASNTPDLIIQKQPHSSYTSQNEYTSGLVDNNIKEQKVYNNEEIKVDGNVFKAFEKHFTTKAIELDNISAYLNRSTETKEENAITLTKASSSSEAARSTMQKTLHTAFRKIKRMADQPVALRNTKNPHYHAPMMTAYKANAAMVGSAPGNRIQATSRIQWLKKNNTQLMNTLSWDGYVYALRGGLGVDVNYNRYKVNDVNNSTVGLTYSPKFSINKTISFEPAIRFKMGVVNLNPTSELIGSKIEIERHNLISLFENEEQISGSQLWYRDVGLGFMMNTKWFYAGFNADNLGRHNNNFYTGDLSKKYREHIHYTAVIGTEYHSFTRDIKISGYTLYQNYGKLNELWVGGNFQYKWLQAGLGMNTNTDLGASLGAVSNRFSFHYNIDYTKSRLLEGRFLSHQITMKILLKPSRYAIKFLNL